jgi:hypothetical protein
MSRRIVMSIAASIIIGIACIAMISTDAFAFRGGAGRAGVGHAGVGVHHVRVAPVRRGVAVGVGAAAATGAYAHCGYYPYPACY